MHSWQSQWRLRHTAAALAALGLALAWGGVRATAGARDGATVTVLGLETNGATRPLGIDDPHPRLTWHVAASTPGVVQTYRHVLVATHPDLLQPGRADGWDSGAVATGDPWIIYAGVPLRSRTRYYWTVRASTNVGGAGTWAPPEWFETAILSPADWAGQWIAGPERKGPLTQTEGEADDAAIRAAGEFCRPVGWLTSGWAATAKKNNQGECRELRPAPMFRKTFSITRPVARARLYASGLGYADLALNGQPTSSRQLAPAFTDYEKTVLYTTDDVTALVVQGQNVVSMVLGSGHFDDAARTWDWGWEDAEWRATPRARVDLRITYTDGAEEVVASGATWKVSAEGPTRFDSFYLGETYDARRDAALWREPGFDDRAWAGARVVGGPAGTLRAEAHEPIRVVQRLEPGRRSEPKPGIVVYDVGQNLTGWADLVVEAPAGTPIEIFYTEKIGEDGTASAVGNDLVYGQLQTDYYVARGGAPETWTPRFSYKGFQYVQVSAPGGTPLAPAVRVSIAGISQVRSSLARTSQFGVSQPTLARIHANTRWAIESNLHGIITDTPVYEKNGWTGDAQLTAGAASLMFDTERLYRKMFQDMADAQTAEGEVPLLSPSNRNYGYVGKPAFKPADCCGATPAWDAFWFVLPWESYMRHGDVRALARTYPLMRKYLDEWVPRWTGRDGDGYAHTLTAGLGDWLPPKDVPTINALVSSAFYAHMARIAADTARALKDEAGAARYDALAARVRDDFNARFLGSDGVYREKPEDGFVQTAQILPLAFGLVPDARRASVAERLADDIVTRRRGHAYVGVIGATYVLPVLTATGHHDVAVEVATKTDEPSWGYWTDALKFTALGESWPADTRSRNHHFFGAIAQWLYEDLAGIRPIEPGFALIEYAPEVPAAGLDSVSATHDSVRGPVRSAWMRGPSGVSFTVVVPPNARGRILLPAADASSVRLEDGGGLRPLSGAAGVQIGAVTDGRLRIDVGSGEYRFHVAGTPRVGQIHRSAPGAAQGLNPAPAPSSR
jgi:alpha-L-rhamnosidase